MRIFYPSGLKAFSSRFVALAAVTLILSGCDETGAFNPQSAFGSNSDATTGEATQAPAAEFIEEEVEKPDVFYAKEPALWDGRPSLGGVWVAHPEAGQPERVIVRNLSNGQFVVSALFRRERDIPGPRLQLSSDAAQAIGVLAGAPVELEVVALRTEQIPVVPPEPEVDPDAVAPIDAPEEIEEQTLDPIAAAGAAIEAAPETPSESSSSVVAATAVAAASAAEEETSEEKATEPLFSLTRPYVQVAVFGVEANAEAVSEQMRSIGLIPTVREEEAGGKPLWRVVIGPATTRSERREIIDKVKAEGYADAYTVKQ